MYSVGLVVVLIKCRFIAQTHCMPAVRGLITAVGHQGMILLSTCSVLSQLDLTLASGSLHTIFQNMDTVTCWLWSQLFFNPS